MNLLRPLSMLPLVLAIAACAPKRKVVFYPPKPVAVAPQPQPATPPPPAPLAHTFAAPQVVLDSARTALDQGHPDFALAKLDALKPEQLQGDVKLSYMILRASVYSAEGRHLSAVRDRVTIDALLPSGEARRRNQEAILQGLAQLPPEQLGALPVVARDTFGGWLALGTALAATPEQRPAALTQWRRDFPGHPADSDVIAARAAAPAAPALPAPAAAPVAAPAGPAENVHSTSAASPQIAVLLPAGGPHSAFGEALRQGIAAAYFDDKSPDKPALRFYDSESGDATGLYRKAIAEGADVVVGPLRKDQVLALAAEELSIPVLALNQVEASHDDLYQFGLLPEEEVEQVADLAWADGRRSLALLAPAKELGQRSSQHLVSYWRELGGRVAVAASYSSRDQNFAAPVQQILGSAADSVLLVGEPRDARLLVSQFRTIGGNRLPIYASAGVYSGRTNRPEDAELSGVALCDADWLLAPEQSALRQAIFENLRPADNVVRLVAMGLDAYRLARTLIDQPDSAIRLDGATGTLTVGPGQHIRRQLRCGQFGPTGDFQLRRANP